MRRGCPSKLPPNQHCASGPVATGVLLHWLKTGSTYPGEGPLAQLVELRTFNLSPPPSPSDFVTEAHTVTRPAQRQVVMSASSLRSLLWLNYSGGETYVRARGLAERTINEQTATVARISRDCRVPPLLLSSDDLAEWFRERGACRTVLAPPIERRCGHGSTLPDAVRHPVQTIRRANSAD